MYQPTQEHRGHFDLPDKTRFDLEDSIAVWQDKLEHLAYKYNDDLNKLRHKCTNYDDVKRDIERGAFPYLSPHQHGAAIDCIWAEAKRRVREAQLEKSRTETKAANYDKNKALKRLEKRDRDYNELLRENQRLKMERDSYARSNGQLVRRNKEWKQKTEKRDRAIARLQKKIDNLTN